MKLAIQELKSRIFGGVSPAMATPLLPEGDQVNVTATERLIDYLIAAGVRGLFVGGTTGEGITLSIPERKRLHECSLNAVAGRVPALIHVGANTTAETVSLARHAQKYGADAIVAVSPTFYPIHDDAQLDYYKAIYETAPDIPMLAYDIPHMAVNGISARLLGRLSSEIPSFAGVKTSHQDAQHIRRIIDTASPHNVILAGNERIALASLALGASGLISGLSTAIPEPFVRLTGAFFSGDLPSARNQQRIINQLLDLMPPGARIGAIKGVLEHRGIDAGHPVHPRPLPPGDWQPWSRITQLLDESATAVSYTGKQ